MSEVVYLLLAGGLLTLVLGFPLWALLDMVGHPKDRFPQRNGWIAGLVTASALGLGSFVVLMYVTSVRKELTKGPGATQAISDRDAALSAWRDEREAEDRRRHEAIKAEERETALRELRETGKSSRNYCALHDRWCIASEAGPHPPGGHKPN